MLAGDLEYRVEAEFVELTGRFSRPPDIGLVDGRDHRHVERTHLLDDLEVGGNQSLLPVKDDDDNIRLLQCFAAAIDDECVEGILAGAEEAPGVEQCELHLLPRRGMLDHIARRPGHGRDDRPARAGDAIEQRGLTDVRPSNEHDKGQAACHGQSVPAPKCAIAGINGLRAERLDGLTA